jgi:signal transduction histidine kinase
MESLRARRSGRAGSGGAWARVLADFALAGSLLAFALFATRLAGRNQPDATPLDGLGYALLVLAIAPLVVRRRWPVAVLAVSTVAVAGYLVGAYPYGPVLIGYVLAMYSVAVRLPIRPAAVAAAASLLVLSAHILVPGGPGLAGVLPASAWTVVPFAIGVTVRLNREATARARADQARRQADDERIRIAQEVHDVVGHGLAAINMQAEIALHLLPKRPEQAEAALAAISRTSREALDELRVTLAVVRRGDDRQPAPGLGQVPELRDRLAAAGLAVSVDVAGEPRDLPAAVDLAGYRVVQESLTNVLRHAGPATAAVRIGYGAADVTVEVVDSGRGAGGVDAPRDGAGHGIAGMRERVTALGGDLIAGPERGGGFRVYARIPAEPRS